VIKSDFQKLADLRIREAQILLQSGEPDGAYYLAGYAVECALKACIIRRALVEPGYWPDKKFVQDCHTHDLKALVKIADLQTELDAAGPVTKNWGDVKDWTEEDRYKHGKLLRDVQQFYNAIADPAEGVLQWLKARW
jgi:hypothetical protein